MPLRKAASVAAAMVTLGAFASRCFASTTIDFETPDLGGTAWQVIDPYVAGGVVFTAPAPIGLVRECDLVSRATACGPCTNQLLGTAAYAGCPIGAYDAPILATFQPEAGPVHSVAVTVQTLSYTTLYLMMYDASDVLVGSGESGVALAYEGCGDPETSYMTSRGTVHAFSSVPVAYARVFVVSGWTCPGVPGCYIACGPFAIDDFRFGTESVPARPASWGRLKTLHR